MTERPFGLSKRQYECLKLASAHRTSKEIGVELGLSPHTVDGHIQAGIAALGVADRAAAARLIAGHLSTQAPPDPLTGQSPPVENAAVLEAIPGGQVVAPAARQGRQINLGVWTRLGIIVGLASMSIFAVVLLIVGADVIARRTHPPVSLPANR